MIPDLIKGIDRTPAFDPCEVKEIIEKIFSSDYNDQRHGLNLLRIWEIGKGDDLPVAISSTIHLLQAFISDANNSLDANNLYCFAIIRFINHISEQAKEGNFSIPLQSAARKLNIPSSMVEIRNSATHGVVPDILDLRINAQIAFEWLQQNFWIPYYNSYERIENAYVLPELETNISQALTTYQKSMIRLLKNLPNTLLGKNSDANLLLKPLNQFLIKFREKDAFMTILCSPGHLLPPSFYLKKLKARSEEESKFLTTDSPQIPLFVRNIWRPLLNNLNKKDLLRKFLVKLISEQSKHCPLTDRMIACWVILTLNSSTKPYINHLIKPNWRALLESAVQLPTDYTLSFLPLLVNKMDPPLPQERINALYSHVTTYLAKFATDKKTHNHQNQPMYSAEDLESFKHAEYQKKHPNSNPFVLMTCYDDLSSLPDGHDIGSEPIHTEEAVKEKEKPMEEVTSNELEDELDLDFESTGASDIKFKQAFIF